MKSKVHSEDKVILAVNSFLQEFDFSNIKDPKEAIATIFAEAVLFGALRASINKMMNKSKVNNDLTREISSIMEKRFSVRVMNDMRIFSFEDGKGTIWISKGLVRLLNREELIGVMLHEIGHGKEKLKILYDHLTSNPKNPRKLKSLCSVLADLIKSRGVVTDPVMMTRVYLLTYIMYTNLVDNPYSGLYKWSYADLAIQHGYWDEYESALHKINRYIMRQNKSNIAQKIQKAEERAPGTAEQLKRDLGNSAGDSSDNIETQAKKLTTSQKETPDRSFISRFIRSIF